VSLELRRTAISGGQGRAGPAIELPSSRHPSAPWSPPSQPSPFLRLKLWIPCPGPSRGKPDPPVAPFVRRAGSGTSAGSTGTARPYTFQEPPPDKASGRNYDTISKIHQPALVAQACGCRTARNGAAPARANSGRLVGLQATSPEGRWPVHCAGREKKPPTITVEAEWPGRRDGPAGKARSLLRAGSIVGDTAGRPR